MVTIKLDQKWVDYLIRQPESGMGYQKVDVRFRDNRVLTSVLVFNAKDLELPEECVGVDIEEIQLHKDQ
jgi:hypothetical protein